MPYFTSKERTFMEDLLTWWEEGLAASKDSMIDDPTIESAEDLVTVTGDIHEQRRTIESIRGKLRES